MTARPLTSLPTISVVVPARGSEDHLRRCLDGLVCQQVPPTEVIVVIDGGEDGPAAVARSRNAVVVRTCRRGPAGARNLGAGTARGDILLFVDADVVCPPTAVGDVAAAFAADPGLDALFGSYDDAPDDPGFFSQYRNLLHHYFHQAARERAATF